MLISQCNVNQAVNCRWQTSQRLFTFHTQSFSIYLDVFRRHMARDHGRTSVSGAHILCVCVRTCMYVCVYRVCIDFLGLSCGFRLQELGMLITGVWTTRNHRNSLLALHSTFLSGIIPLSVQANLQRWRWSGKPWADGADFYALW